MATARKLRVLPGSLPKTARGESAIKRHVKTQEPRGVAELVKRMREDEAFAFGIKIINGIIKTIQVTFEPADDDASKAVAENMEEHWYAHLSEMLEAIEYGRAAFEKVYRWDFQRSLHLLDSLDYLPYELTKMDLDKGEFRGVCVGAGESAVHLGPEASWWLAINPTPLEPHGKTIYLPAPYEVWKQRREHDRRENIWYKRFSIGRGVAYAPAQAMGSPVTGRGDIGEVDESGQPIDPMLATKRALQEIEAGGDLVLPSSRDESGQKHYEYTPAQDLKDGAANENRRRMLDVMALRSLGIPERSITQDSTTGARAVADAHVKVLHDTCEDYAAQIIASFQSNVIDPAVMANGCGPIVLNWRPLGDKSEGRIDEIVRAALAAPQPSSLITEGVIDFPKMVEAAGIPLGPDPLGALQRAKAPAAAPAQPGYRFGSLNDEFDRACQLRRELIKRAGDAATD